MRRRFLSSSSARWLLRDAGRPSPYGRDDTIRPGLRALEAPWEEWLVLDSSAMRRARELKRDFVSACSVSDGRESTRKAAREVLELVAEAVGREGPPELAPLEAAASLVGEDLVLLRQEATEPAVVCAAVVCFSIGQLDAKLGQPLDVIHRPVPGAESLSKPLERVFAAIRPDRGFSRHNLEFRWSGDLLHPSLAEPDAKGVLEDRGGRGISDLHLRVEYQTLRRLPRTDHILFTIASFTDPLAALVRDTPAAAKPLLARVRSFSDRLCEYKGITPDIRDALIDYLQEAAASSTTP